ncbi:MAG: SDR family NAD(P)-dependent oxidoreductase [Bacteroidales bacterium]
MKKTALITGASKGIGKAIANTFKKNGIQCILPSHDEMNLSDPSSIRDYIASLKVKIDIIVNNAGINIIAEHEFIDNKLFDEMLQVNLKAPLQIVQGLSSQMKQNYYGRIVNISSIWSQISKEGRLAYSSSKAGINGMTRALALELAPYNVLVNAVAPGYVNTDLTKQNNSIEQITSIAANIPMLRMAEPEEIAELVYFLCSDKNTYITGQVIIADGGYICK